MVRVIGFAALLLLLLLLFGTLGCSVVGFGGCCWGCWEEGHELNCCLLIVGLRRLSLNASLNASVLIVMVYWGGLDWFCLASWLVG